MSTRAPAAWAAELRPQRRRRSAAWAWFRAASNPDSTAWRSCLGEAAEAAVVSRRASRLGVREPLGADRFAVPAGPPALALGLARREAAGSPVVLRTESL